ncbi:transposase [Xenorhabdus anantnagensis]|uniref:Transposase n=1 Tax=Xenorhabdus anantnagensis TaxID=3025875 RepID=A0ABT5LSS6_9GAMM|nr:transposase [Xenorhabdus anantnagensis]MDC9597480.1 transposase [Xenorhabdus anantnagensis]
MPRYPAEFKRAIQEKIISPRSVSISLLAKTLGISKNTLYRWLREAMEMTNKCPGEKIKLLEQTMSPKSTQKLLQVTITTVIKI